MNGVFHFALYMYDFYTYFLLCIGLLQYRAWNRPKRVTYWPAKLSDPNTPITISREHNQYKWLNVSEAVQTAFGDAMKQELRKCDTFLQKYLAIA